MAGWATTITIDANDAFGVFIPNGGPGGNSSLASQVERLQTFISLYNDGLAAPAGAPDARYVELHGADVPTPIPGYDGVSTDQIDPADPDLTTLDLSAAGWDYLMVKWGNDSVYYYVGGASSIQVNNHVNPNGASHYRFFNVTGNIPGVPDGGLPLVMMGCGLVGMALVRCRA